MSLLRAVATFGGFTLLSRIVGLVRDQMVAAMLGTTALADAFFVAFRLPNFFRALFAEGAFSAAFVPLYAKILATDGRAVAQAFAERALALLLVALIVFVSLAEWFTPAVIALIAPGFGDDPVRFGHAVTFTRITFPYLLFISLVSLYGGALNALGKFAATAATPILLNLTMIASLALLPPFLPSSAHAAAWGVTLAGITQFLFLGWAMKRAGLSLGLPRPRLTPNVRRLFVILLPAALGSGVVQINLLVGQMLASLLPAGSISYLYNADRFYQLPIGVVGVAISTALLPLLSRQLGEGDEAGARDSQNRAIELAFALGIPSAFALIAIPREMIQVVLEHGLFDAVSTANTAMALLAYAVGLPAIVAVKALTPAFYARHDTRTPLRIAIVGVIGNILLCLALMPWLSFVGLALASAVVAWLNTAQYAVTLYRRGLWAPDARLKDRLWRILLAGLVMVAVLKGLAWLLAPWFARGLTWEIPALILIILAGMASYGLAATLIGALRPSDLKAALRRRPGAGKGGSGGSGGLTEG